MLSIFSLLAIAADFDFVPEYLVVGKPLNVTWSSNSSIIVNLNITLLNVTTSQLLDADIPLFRNRSQFTVPEEYVDKSAKLILVKANSDSDVIVTGPPLIIKAAGDPKAITPDDAIRNFNTIESQLDSSDAFGWEIQSIFILLLSIGLIN